MTRVAAKVTCSDQDRKELERLGSSRTDQARPTVRPGATQQPNLVPDHSYCFNPRPTVRPGATQQHD